MGRIEKIVVSTVLFLVAVILALSFRGGGVEGGDQQAGPVASAPAPGEMAGRQAREATPTPQSILAPTSGPAGLLAMGPGEARPAPEKSPAPPPPPAQAQPLPGMLLLTLEGLEASRIENLMLYTWRAGDTFAALAERYYGAATHAGRLRSANEGRGEQTLAAGDVIFVTAAEAPTTRTRSAEAETYGGGSIYVVKKGDVLGGISQTVYGTSKHWRRIFEANQDVLSTPNHIREGMRLRIPAE